MFDPHRIGPERTSSYSRNKGRAIHRRVVATPSVSLTMNDLERLYPIMEKNGFIPQPASPFFGKVVNYRVFADGVDVTSEYNEIPAATDPVTFSSGWYLFVVPNIQRTGLDGLFMGFKFIRISSGTYNVSGSTSGARVYDLGSSSAGVTDYIDLTGENGTVVSMSLVPQYYTNDGDILLNEDLVLFPM